MAFISRDLGESDIVPPSTTIQIASQFLHLSNLPIEFGALPSVSCQRDTLLDGLFQWRRFDFQTTNLFHFIYLSHSLVLQLDLPHLEIHTPLQKGMIQTPSPITSHIQFHHSDQQEQSPFNEINGPFRKVHERPTR